MGEQHLQTSTFQPPQPNLQEEFHTSRLEWWRYPDQTVICVSIGVHRSHMTGAATRGPSASHSCLVIPVHDMPAVQRSWRHVTTVTTSPNQHVRP